MTSETKSQIEGHWRGYYQTIEDQMAGKKTTSPCALPVQAKQTFRERWWKRL